MEISMAAPPGPDMTGMPRGSGTPTDRTGMMVLRKMELEEQIKERLAEERAGLCRKKAAETGGRFGEPSLPEGEERPTLNVQR